MSLVTEVVLPAVRDLGLPLLVDPDRDDTVFIPLPLDDLRALVALIVIAAHEEVQELTIQAGICRVPKRRRGQVDHLLSELNGKRRFLQWFVREELVVAEIDVELACGGDPREACRLALYRLIAALKEEREQITGVARRRGRSRLEREVTALLAQHSLGEGSDGER